MKTTIQDYIYIQPNFFNTKFCNKVLKEVKTLNFTPNLFYNPNNDVSTDRSGETESLMSSELIPSNDLLLKQLWIIPAYHSMNSSKVPHLSENDLSEPSDSIIEKSFCNPNGGSI